MKFELFAQNMTDLKTFSMGRYASIRLAWLAAQAAEEKMPLDAPDFTMLEAEIDRDGSAYLMTLGAHHYTIAK